MPDAVLPPVVMFDHVTVTYGGQLALRDVTGVFAGGAAGLLGPNGAGKSTLLKSLLGFVRPTAGSMRVLGLDVATKPLEIRARLGYMPESDAHIPGMTAVTFVSYCAQLAGLPPSDAIQRAHEVLYYVGLGEARYRVIDTYSTGMRQRIKLAQALVHDPDLLFLDEPTNGMDPKGRDEMIGRCPGDAARGQGQSGRDPSGTGRTSGAKPVLHQQVRTRRVTARHRPASGILSGSRYDPFGFCASFRGAVVRAQSRWPQETLAIALITAMLSRSFLTRSLAPSAYQRNGWQIRGFTTRRSLRLAPTGEGRQ